MRYLGGKGRWHIGKWSKFVNRRSHEEGMGLIQFLEIVFIMLTHRRVLVTIFGVCLSRYFCRLFLLSHLL